MILGGAEGYVWGITLSNRPLHADVSGSFQLSYKLQNNLGCRLRIYRFLSAWERLVAPGLGAWNIELRAQMVIGVNREWSGNTTTRSQTTVKINRRKPMIGNVHINCRMLIIKVAVHFPNVSQRQGATGALGSCYQLSSQPFLHRASSQGKRHVLVSVSPDGAKTTCLRSCCLQTL